MKRIKHLVYLEAKLCTKGHWSNLARANFLLLCYVVIQPIVISMVIT